MLKKKIIKYGKPFLDIEKIKENFFSNNTSLLKKILKIRKIYLKQPKRKFCKVCNKKLQGEYFINHKIKYIICNQCSHLNGSNQDTTDFSKKIYLSKKVDYIKNYHESFSQNFIERQKKIYDPKVKFLKNIFKNHKKIKVLDVGTGSGYFVSSLLDARFKDAIGLEFSKSQINFGKSIFKKIGKDDTKLHFIEYSKIIEYVKKTDFECLTLIGVLEHLVDMKNFLKCVNENKKIKYIYLCVPMFSFSCIFENIFDKVFNRHLGGGHTHLFTNKSLNLLMAKFGFKSHSEWWFGTDFTDLFRSINVSVFKKNPGLVGKITEFKNLVDRFQITVDKNKLSSQAHIFFKR